MYTCKYINLCTKTRGMLNLSFYTTVAADQKTRYQIPSFNVPMIRHLVSDNFWPWAIDFHRFFTICSWFICKRICNNTKYVYNMHIIVIHIYLKSYIDGIHISHIYIFCIFLLQYSGWIIKNATNLQPPTSTRIFTFFLAAHSQLRSCLLGVDDWRSLPANVVLSHSCHLSKRWYHDTPPRHPGCCGTYVSIYCGTM